MDYTTIINALIHYGSIMGLVLFLLTFTTSIIVEVIKGMFPKLPTNILVFIVAVAVTLLALATAMTVLEITFMWHYVAGAVVLAIFTAYAAMFGFDKFKELFDRLKAFKAQ